MYVFSMLDLHRIKVVPASDGRVWLCYPIETADVELVKDAACQVYTAFRAMSLKIRGAEITKCRKEMPFDS